MRPEDVPMYKLEDGCANSGSLNARYGSPRFERMDQAAGEVVCCSLDGSSSTRFDGTTCLSGDDTAHMVTYQQAVDICEDLSMRLCSSAEELDKSCFTGCEYDHALVWISMRPEDVPMYKLEDGCSTSGSLNARYGSPRFERMDQAAGEVVCCSLDGSSSTRSYGTKCLSGDDTAHMVTYQQAVDICEYLSMRLCSNTEELDKSCGGGCEYDHALVWTSKKKDVPMYKLEDGCSNSGSLNA